MWTWRSLTPALRATPEVRRLLDQTAEVLTSAGVLVQRTTRRAAPLPGRARLPVYVPSGRARPTAPLLAAGAVVIVSSPTEARVVRDLLGQAGLVSTDAPADPDSPQPPYRILRAAPGAWGGRLPDLQRLGRAADRARQLETGLAEAVGALTMAAPQLLGA